MQKLPQEKVYYGLCEYPHIKFYLYDDTHATKPQPLYCGEKCPLQPVYAIITLT